MLALLFFTHSVLALNVAAPKVLWNTSVWPSQARSFAANGSTVVSNNGSVVEGRDAQTGSLKYSLSFAGFSYISNELILLHQNTTLSAFEVETGASRFTNFLDAKVEQALVMGEYFVVTNGSALWAGTTATGASRWEMATLKTVSGLTYCGPGQFCVQSASGMLRIEVATGVVTWGPKPSFDFSTSRAFVSLSDSKGRLAVASGGYLNLHSIALVEADSGAVLWNMSLGPDRTVIDLAINTNVLAVTYMKMDEGHSNNAYPCEAVGLDISNGQSLFRYGPVGATMGESRFLPNGNIVYIGDEAILTVNGTTGVVECALTDNVQDYAESSGPAVLGTRFYATYFQIRSSYSKQQLVALEC